VAADTDSIPLSVIIPTYDRVDRLQSCLASLNRQTQPVTDWEVVVVIDGSTDGTREMLAGLATPYRLRVCEQDHLGTGAALKRGVAAASGCYCLFLGDNVVAQPDLVGEHLRAQQANRGVVCLGPIKLTPTPQADWYAREFVEHWNQHYTGLNAGAPSWFDCSADNLSAPRAAIVEADGFVADLSASFEVELAHNLERHGLGVMFIAQAAVEQVEDRDFDRLTTEAERRGHVHAELCRRQPDMLPQLLGNFIETTLRTLFMRRFLLALNISPRWLRVMGRMANRGKQRADWFKFIEDTSYWRGVRRATPDAETWRRLTHGTPILMYHAFGKPGEAPSRYILPVDRFKRQMAWLKRLRYRVLSLEDYLHYRAEDRLLPTRSVVITADDGYADNYAVAYPILRHYGLPASIFLVSGNVGDVNRWDEQGLLRDRALLSWTEIKEMLRDGVTFGAHTQTHPMLTAVSPDRARAEIAGSRAELEQALGQPIRLFSYPHGKYDATARSIVEQEGYSGACSTRAGMNSPATPEFELRRTEVRGTDSFVRFALALWLGDDHLPPRRRQKRATT
jgi:peptidoglycan/xylan/chitin deacetylase (PgdA/CDA1 family)/GT2 family glycosyltransferase